jgi:YhcN/YlaJ family sporulation lipoprotein
MSKCIKIDEENNNIGKITLKGMIKMKKSSFLLTFLCLLLIGCQANNDNNNDISQNGDGIRNISTNDDKQGKKLSATQIAERLVKIASADADVRDATAIVAGKYALVGIDVDKDIDRSKVGTIKFTITEALQKDPYGANAVVTADADIVTRLKEMAKEIRNGKPILGVMEELAAIIGRIIPEVPDESHKSHPEPTEENEPKMEGGKNKLDETQNDQANDMIKNRDIEKGNGEEQQPQDGQEQGEEGQGEEEDITEEEVEQGE